MQTRRGQSRRQQHLPPTAPVGAQHLMAAHAQHAPVCRTCRPQHPHGHKLVPPLEAEVDHRAAGRCRYPEPKLAKVARCGGVGVPGCRCCRGLPVAGRERVRMGSGSGAAGSGTALVNTAVPSEATRSWI